MSLEVFLLKKVLNNIKSSMKVCVYISLAFLLLSLISTQAFKDINDNIINI